MSLVLTEDQLMFRDATKRFAAERAPVAQLRKLRDDSDAIGFSRQNSWSFVARTYLFDEYIKQHVEQGYDMIVNLAAGLDARAYRMQLPKTLKWVDYDLPGMIDYKK